MNLNNFSRKFVVYLIHILTASGVIAGFLALLSVMSENLVGAFLWLGLAFFIDGIDGLCSGLVLLAFINLIIFIYISGNNTDTTLIQVLFICVIIFFIINIYLYMYI